MRIGKRLGPDATPQGRAGELVTMTRVRRTQAQACGESPQVVIRKS